VKKYKKEVRIGNVVIGGNNPVRVQSMTKTDTRNVEDTVKQILQLEEHGCEIVRVAVKDAEAATKIADIKNQFIYHSLQISILILGLQLKQLREVLIKSV